MITIARESPLGPDLALLMARHTADMTAAVAGVAGRTADLTATVADLSHRTVKLAESLDNQGLQIDCLVRDSYRLGTALDDLTDTHAPAFPRVA